MYYIQEDDPMPPLVRQAKVCSSVLTASIVTGLMASKQFDQIVLYRTIFGDTVTNEVLSSSVDLAGVLVAGIMMSVIGRKNAVIAVNVVFMVPLLVSAADLGSTFDYYGMLLSRLTSNYLVPVYIVYTAEMTEPRFRASFLSCYVICYHSGVFMSKLFMSGSKLLTVFSLVVAIASIVLAFRTPETPYWLIRTKRPDDADQLFLWLRGEGNEAAEAELDALQDAGATESPQTNLNAIQGSTFYMPLLIYLGMQLADKNMCFFMTGSVAEGKATTNQISGSKLWEPKFLNLSTLELLRLLGPMLGGVIYLVVCYFIGRRPLFFASTLLGLLLFFILKLDPASLDLALIIAYMCNFTSYLGMHQSMHILPCEIFPAVIRELGVAVCEFLNVSFRVLENWTMYGGYETWYYKTFFSVRWILIPFGLCFSFFFFPETKGLTLAECEKFANKLKVQFLDDPEPKDE